MKIAKIFKHGNSQAVRLPREFRVAEDSLFIRKSGDTIILTPRKSSGWQNIRAAIAMFKGGIERNQPANCDIRDRPIRWD